jgi:hypothetical protein
LPAMEIFKWGFLHLVVLIQNISGQHGVI